MGGNVKEPETLVFGAKLKCPYGSQDTYLLVDDTVSKKINELPVCVVTDSKKYLNITPFGECFAGGSCESQWELASAWENPDGQDELVNGKEIITTASHIVCIAQGMIITPQNSGQDGVIAEQLRFIWGIDPELLAVLCNPYGSVYTPRDLSEKALDFLEAAVARRGGEIDLTKYGKSPLGKLWDNAVGKSEDMVDALTIMAINHLTGVDVTNAYRGPMDYPVATSLMGITGLYGPTSSQLFSKQDESKGWLMQEMKVSSERRLNPETLGALRDYCTEKAQKVAAGGYNKWAQENKATIEGIGKILEGILILVVAKIGSSGSIGNTIKDVSEGAETKTFTSSDKYVGETANAIEAKYPNRVVDVNKDVFRPNGTKLTDFDIELDTVVIQVKSGSGKGLTAQMAESTTGTTKTVIGYCPDLNTSSALVRGAKAAGFDVFTTLEDLLNYLANN
jgi:hypothetical protein